MPDSISQAIALATAGAVMAAIGWLVGKANPRLIPVATVCGAVSALAFLHHPTGWQIIAVAAIGALSLGSSTDSHSRRLYDLPVSVALLVGATVLASTSRAGITTWFLGATFTTLPFAALRLRAEAGRTPWGDILYSGLCGALAGPIYGPCALVIATILARLLGQENNRPWGTAMAMATTLALLIDAVLTLGRPL